MILFWFLPHFLACESFVIDLSKFCVEHLANNFSRTKLVVLGRKRKILSWKLDGNPIKPFCVFKFLGLRFNAQHSWKHHFNAANVEVTHSITIHKSPLWGGVWLSQQLRCMEKNFPQLTYGTDIWGYTMSSIQELPQHYFVLSLLTIPQATPSAYLRTEVGLIPIETHSYPAVAMFWLLWVILAFQRNVLKNRLKIPTMSSGQIESDPF